MTRRWPGRELARGSILIYVNRARSTVKKCTPSIDQLAVGRVLGQFWERYGGQPREVSPIWDRWLRAYHWRVNVEIAVERVIVWSDLACIGKPKVYGTPLPAQLPSAQRIPARGAAPRIDHLRAVERIARLPNILLGWVGIDGFPMIVAVTVAGTEPQGILLRSADALVPAGGRRAGLLGHWFSRHVVGQRQRKHTGWLEADPAAGRVLYAPHTRSGYTLPDSRFAYNLSAGFVTQRGLRQARREGFLDG